jgi:uncharacterized repeat protein (TIGR04042 family)
MPMPEMRFDIAWPDGLRESCYSPSLVIKDYLAENQVYDLADFLQRSRTALNIASERVREKYGFPCSRALGQLAKIETAAARFLEPGGNVSVLSFHDL